MYGNGWFRSAILVALAGQSDFRTPVESIGLQKPDMLGYGAADANFSP